MYTLFVGTLLVHTLLMNVLVLVLRAILLGSMSINLVGASVNTMMVASQQERMLMQ